MRIGHGYDAHRLTQGRKLILGGVEIPFEKGLMGHSDADVVVHALMDALLGAMGKDDIGAWFPDSDREYKDISSLRLLARVGTLLQEAGYRLQNADVTVVAQEPRLRPHIPAMKKAVAEALGAPEGAVNIKATTEEGMGFTGRGEGIAAHAVCLIASLETENQ